jgi:hypothetical protein
VICGTDSGGELVLLPDAARPAEHTLVRYSAADGSKSTVGTYDATSLEYLETPTVLVSGYHIALNSTQPQPTITVLRT